MKMKSMIIYASHHHGNTEKVVKYIAEHYDITLVNAEETSEVDFDGYDLIGFASGMDFGKFYPPVTDLAAKLPVGKSVYAIYTCARDDKKYGSQIEKIAKETNCTYLGKYGCRGYNTFGPWKIIGGLNKSNPNQEELDGARLFYERILQLKEG